MNFYQLIGGIDFVVTIFTRAKILDLETIPFKPEVEKYILSLKIPDIFEELEASFLQRIDENYAANDTFPQYEIFEGFADWEIKDGFCRKKPTTRISQCIQRTMQYLRALSSPWDYHSLRLRESINPNPFAQVISHERIREIETSNNQEMIKQHARWFNEFGNLKLSEKLQVLKKMDDLQGEPKALRFMINKKYLVTISVISPNWNNNVIHIISLMISNRIYTSMIFEIGWQNKDFMSNNCREWI